MVLAKLNAITPAQIEQARGMFARVEFGLVIDKAKVAATAPDQLAVYNALKSLGVEGPFQITPDILAKALTQAGKTADTLQMKMAACPFGGHMPPLPKG